MKSIKIVGYKQSRRACGATALRMVLEYFGVHISERKIIALAGGLKRYGLRTVVLGDVARTLGFQSVAYTYNKKLSGKKAEYRMPSINDIKQFLRSDVPVIVAVRAAILFQRKEDDRRNGHFIVITRVAGNRVYYHDPWDGKIHSMTRDHFLFAWHANVMDSSAYLLAVWKP